ncbi:hypothetical protein ACFQWC_14745 [Rossellomorea sp. GCM10028870]|uniref:hypothetical protein n=1 Tax=unclassified Rossellomorea TaxID=2837526 RepID=UPI0030DE5762
MKKQDERTSTTEANMELNERFYGSNEKEADPAPPTYIQNNTAAVKITGDDE